VSLSNIVNETFGDISIKTQFFQSTFKGDFCNAHWLKKNYDDDHTRRYKILDDF